MCDEFKTPNTSYRAGSDTRTLNRIADALGVLVSSFYGPESIRGDAAARTKPEETAVLALVRTYLEAVDPAARERFLSAVQVMTGAAVR